MHITFLLAALAASVPLSRAYAASAPLPGKTIVLTQGLTVTPAANLNITYDVVPSYDPTEKVLASWTGDKLQYIITVARLPEGWVRADKYFAGLRHDLGSASVTVKAVRSGQYAAKRPLRGSYEEHRVKLPDSAAPLTQVSHFLTDGKTSFVANATLMDPAAAKRMLTESVQILRTAALPSDGGHRAAAEPGSGQRAFAGRWVSDTTLPDGRRMRVDWTLKRDQSFATHARLDDKLVLNASGTWRLQGQTIFSTYMRSQPPLPEGSKEDSDDISSFDGASLVLVSRRTGQQTAYVRQP